MNKNIKRVCVNDRIRVWKINMLLVNKKSDVKLKFHVQNFVFNIKTDSDLLVKFKPAEMVSRVALMFLRIVVTGLFCFEVSLYSLEFSVVYRVSF